MEKHILTYASGGADKTAVVITKIRNSGIDVTGEVIYTGADEGAVILEDLIKHPEYDAAIKQRNYYYFDYLRNAYCSYFNKQQEAAL